MVGIAIVSHGAFAPGLLDAASMLYGDEQCAALALSPDDNPDDFAAKLGETADKLDTGDGVFILADLFGGTPCNRAMSLVAAHSQEGKKRRLIAGVSLPLLIALMDAREEAGFDELAETAMAEAASGIRDVNAIMKKEGLLND